MVAYRGYYVDKISVWEGSNTVKFIKVVATKTINVDDKLAKACRECQIPCKSACKTSSTVGNQVCETRKKPQRFIW